MTVDSDEPFDGLVIVPHWALGHAARRGERADTFATLRSRLRRHLAPDVELADPIAVRLALAWVVPPLAATDPWLGPILKRGGHAWRSVIDAVDEAVGVLRERGDGLPLAARGSDEAAVRAAFLAKAKAALDRELSRVGLVDPRREAELVADRVASADVDEVLIAIGARTMKARGIVEWPLPDICLWRGLDAALSRCGGRATIELPVFDRGFDAERDRDPLDIVIDAVAAALDDAPLTRPISPTLGDLRCEGAPPSMAFQAPVEVRQATDVETQASAIADAVYTSLEASASPPSVVVAWVSTDDRAALASIRVLEEAGIAVCDQRRDRPRRSNLTALAMSVLTLSQRPPLRTEVALMLRSTYIDARRLTETPDEPAARRMLRSLARALEETRTVTGLGRAGLLEATTLASNVTSGDKRARLATIARRLDTLLGQAFAASTRLGHLRAASMLWSELGLAPGPLEALVRRGELPDGAVMRPTRYAELAAIGRDMEAWSSLADALAAYERAMVRLGYEQTAATVETVRHEIAWADAHQVSRPSVALASVRFMSFADVPAEPLALLVIADADSAAWADRPRRAWLITPALEDKLAEAGDPALQPLAQAAPAERLARLALAADAARHVVFTVRSRDEAGTPLAPAPVVEWASRGGATVSVWQPELAERRPLSLRARVLTELSRGGRQAESLVPDAARRALLERRREEAFGTLLADDHPLSSTLPRGELFATALTEETGGGERAISATAIDRLASCVFRGFVAEVLKPRRYSPTHDVADARQAGILVHSALAEAFHATAPLWSVRPRDGARIVELGLEAADRSLAGERAGSRLAQAAADQARASVRAILEWSLADEAWDFAFAEQAVGEGGWSEIELQRVGSRVRVRGRIDRVDVAHEANGLRVIDYKRTESTAHDHTLSFAETKFQLAIYGRAAAVAMGRPPLQGIYLPTQRARPGVNPRIPDGEWNAAHETVGEVARFESTILDLVESVRQGRVGVRPHSPASCVHCEFSGVCRKPRFAPAVVAEEVEPAKPAGRDP